VDDAGGAFVEAGADLGGGGLVGATGVRGHPVAIFAGEDAPGQRGGGDPPYPVVGGGGRQVGHDAAGQKRVGRVGGGDRRDRGQPGQLPGRVAAHPGVAGLARAHGVGEGVGDLLDGGARVPGGDLPDVEVVGAQFAQRVVELAQQFASRGVDPGARQRGQVAGGRGGGGVHARASGEHQFLAGHDIAEQVGEDGLGGAAGVGGGGVDQGA